MRFNERLPGGLSLPVVGWFDTVLSENIPYRLVRDLMTDVCQRTLDSIISPTRILRGESQNQVDNHLADSRATWLIVLPVGVIPFLGHQCSVPPQDRVGRDDGRQFHQRLSTEELAFYGQ